VAFAGCGLPVLGVCVLVVSVTSGKSEQFREAGDFFLLPRVAGKLFSNIGAQALLHHTRRFGSPVLTSSRAGSPSHAAGSLQDPEAEGRQVAWRKRAVRDPCCSLLEGAEPGWAPALVGLSSPAAPAPAGDVLALSRCPRVSPVPPQPTDRTCSPHKP